VHQQRDESDNDERQADVEADRMLRESRLSHSMRLCHCRASQDTTRRRSTH